MAKRDYYEILGVEKSASIQEIKKAYRNILPDEVIGKSKTGWTVPVGYWLADKHDVELEAFYKSAMGSEILDKVSSNQKASKRLIPKWLVKDWRTEYDIK
mgnify:CR=1 FL=1